MRSVKSKGHWNQISSQRDFFDRIATKFNVKKPEDWKLVKIRDIEKEGGRTLLDRHSSSLLVALKSIYQEIEWKPEWFDRKIWTITSQRKFFEMLALKLNIIENKDWGKVSSSQISENGGASILQIYSNSLYKTLKYIFPETTWKLEWFVNIPSKSPGYWKEKQNHRNFLDEIAKKLNIKQQSDWGKVTAKEVLRNGGFSLLTYYNGSLIRALKEIYPEVAWKTEWFSRLERGYWKKKENQKLFLENFAQTFKIKSPKDWGKVTTYQIIERGGHPLLDEYGGSLVKALIQLFPDIRWKREWFGNLRTHNAQYWNSSENHRLFLESIASKYRVISSEDWNRITLSLIKDNGGHGLLYRYNNSLVAALQSNFPETKWKKEWFPSPPRYSPNHWESLENQRRFLDEIAVEYSITNPKDWKRTSSTLIKKHGGYGLLAKYNGSLLQALQRIYSEVDWNSLFNEANYQQDKVAKQIWGFFSEGKISQLHRQPAQARGIKRP